jgi:WD40 repeat protein
VPRPAPGQASVEVLDGAVYLWDVPAAAQPNRLAAPCGSVTAVAITDDGRALAEGCSNGALHLWQIAPGGHAILRGQLSREAGGAVTALDFVPRRHLLAVAYTEATVRLWDSPTWPG